MTVDLTTFISDLEERARMVRHQNEATLVRFINEGYPGRLVQLRGDGVIFVDPLYCGPIDDTIYDCETLDGYIAFSGLQREWYA